RGGMSEVYLAYDQSTQRTVAIKVVNRYRDDHMQRIQNEVKVLGILSHPHILPALEYGEEGPWCYFVMPYAEQGSLRERLVNGPLSQEEAGAILEQVASALQY
ncbi:MAG: serine/threonine protein kinase, partial [Chloroflexi bacterium]